MLVCGIESRLKNKWVLCRARFVLFLPGIPYNHVPRHSDPTSCASYEESQGTWLFSEIETFLAILRSFGSRARGQWWQMLSLWIFRLKIRLNRKRYVPSSWSRRLTGWWRISDHIRKMQPKGKEKYIILRSFRCVPFLRGQDDKMICFSCSPSSWADYFRNFEQPFLSFWSCLPDRLMKNLKKGVGVYGTFLSFWSCPLPGLRRI